MPRFDLSARVIAALIFVGVASLVAKAVFLPGYGIVNVLTDVGYEALPAALLYLLIDQLITRNDEARKRREDAVRALPTAGALDLPEILKALRQGNEIRLGDKSGLNFDGLELADESIADSVLDAAGLDGARLTRIGFSNVTLSRASARLAVIEECRFLNVSMGRADVTGTMFMNCSFEGPSTFEGAVMTDVRFVQCSFGAKVLDGADLRAARFYDCSGEGYGQLSHVDSV
jgi:uncharacterized protein YjbI with pentapeptide repeats